MAAPTQISDDSPSAVVTSSAHSAVSVALLAPRNLGPFDYTVNSETPIPAGTLVRVPLGSRSATGVVLDKGDPELAAKSVAEVGPTFLSSTHLELCRRVSLRWLAPLSSTFKRAFPAPLDEMLDDPVLYAAPQRTPLPRSLPRRYVSLSPGIGMAEAAALAVREILDATAGLLPPGTASQVLVLCPSRKVVTETRRHLKEDLTSYCGDPTSQLGDVTVDRLDRGSLPRWRSGELQVGVATRAAVLWEAPNIVGYVVVDASHPGHVEEAQPYTSSAEVAVISARLTGAAVTLLGDVPSPTFLWGGVGFEEWGSRSEDWPSVSAIPREFGSDPACPPRAVNLISRFLAGRQPASSPARVALVATARNSRLRCLRCSESFPPPADDSSEAAPLTSTEIQVPGRFWSCPRCASSELMMLGWSPDVLALPARRLSSALTHIDPTPSVEVVSPPSLFTDRFDAVLIPGADRYGASPSDPGLAAARLIVQAARAVVPDGLVVLTSAASDGPAAAVATTRSVRSVAEKGWELSVQHALPPHRREIWLTSPGQLPSPPDSLGVGVHGPRRLPSGEYELLLRCGDSRLAAVSAWLSDLRTRHTLRVKVN